MDFSRAVAFFEADGPFLLSTHVNADGDGLGAMLALGSALDKMGRDQLKFQNGQLQMKMRKSGQGFFDGITGCTGYFVFFEYSSCESVGRTAARTEPLPPMA